MVMIVEYALMPSSRQMRVSAPCRPIVTTVSRLVFVVRSGLIATYESPRSVDFINRFAPTYSTPGLLGERRIGVSHWKRRFSPGLRPLEFWAVGRMLFDSPVSTFFRVRLPSCDSV